MKQRLYGKNLKVLIITLIILTVLGVLSQAENSLLSSGVNTLTKGLFQLSALATASADSATREELLKENEELKKENAALRGQLADYIDTKAENEKLWAYYELKKENPSYQIVPSNVIKRDVNDDFYSFTLDIGSSVGVKVNAPVIEEFPLVMECELLEFLESEHVSGIVGKIVNVKAEEAVLSENGKVDPAKLHALMFDQFQNGYYTTGEKAGQAWNAGVPLMKKEG